MRKDNTDKSPLYPLLVFLLLTGMPIAAPAQSTESSVPPTATQSDSQTRLEALQQSISNREQQLAGLRAQLDTAPSADLEARVENLSGELDTLRRTFNQLAAGGIELVEIAPEGEEFDWRQELILVTQPLLENLKGLTEKPRKIERLKSIIERREAESEEIADALTRIEQTLAQHQTSAALPMLENLQQNWQQKDTDNEQALELARFQLASLMGDNTPRLETIKQMVADFLHGRGLTLGLVVLVSVVLYLFTRALLWVILRRKQDKHSRSRQVGHRLASYGYSFFTTLLILVGIMVVLYIRGDLLLLALAIIVLASVALGLRTILPRFVSEARLLLNIGSIREGERVIYQGLPLEVQSINVHSYFSNPALDGVIRLPLSALKDMTSRPSEGESWFPTEPGDVLKMSDGSLAKVIQQTTEFVELQSRTGPIHYYPTLDFLSLDFENLTRSGEFVIVSYFGVDYALQNISLTEVPESLQQAIDKAYRDSRFADHIVSVAVDFHAAAASSLDYIIFVRADASIALSRYAIERIAQQACVDLCNRNHWVIPFQQVVVHRSTAA